MLFWCLWRRRLVFLALGVTGGLAAMPPLQTTPPTHPPPPQPAANTETAGAISDTEPDMDMDDDSQWTDEEPYDDLRRFLNGQSSGDFESDGLYGVY
uniref:Uncharacterized protein n=1 Tax=Drosophila pseudoobscura pseudoobscura TaxID=46245 RepID=A0A0R3NWR7_DROPS